MSGYSTGKPLLYFVSNSLRMKCNEFWLFVLIPKAKCPSSYVSVTN